LQGELLALRDLDDVQQVVEDLREAVDLAIDRIRGPGELGFLGARLDQQRIRVDGLDGIAKLVREDREEIAAGLLGFFDIAESSLGSVVRLAISRCAL
jgi:hypothetical protein